jgi:hypothetical protein
MRMGGFERREKDSNGSPANACGRLYKTLTIVRVSSTNPSFISTDVGSCT